MIHVIAVITARPGRDDTILVDVPRQRSAG